MDKIFINIAAYRDPLLVRTLTEAYSQADNPEALVFALGMQYEQEIYPDLSFIPHEQIKALRYDIPKRPGVTRIRYEITQAAYSNEKYFLMIDSHMRFSKGWDTWLKHNLNNLGEKSIISGLGEIQNNQIRLKTCELIQGQLDLVFQGKEYYEPFTEEDEGKFFKTPYIYCGFMFTYGSFVDEVGFDEYSQFDSEEPYLSWRAFMSGWTIYHTSHWVITHSPDNYYDAAWGGFKSRTFVRTGVESMFRPHMIMLKSLAYVYNDYSMYAVKNAAKKPIEWFLECGYSKSDYKKILDHFNKTIHNNITEDDIIIL